MEDKASKESVVAGGSRGQQLPTGCNLPTKWVLQSRVFFLKRGCSGGICKRSTICVAFVVA